MPANQLMNISANIHHSLLYFKTSNHIIGYVR